VLGAGHPLDAEGADPEVEATGPLGVGARGSRQLGRLAVARGDAALIGDRQPLDGRVGWGPRRRVQLGRGVARGDRGLAVAPELVHRRERALGVGHRPLLVCRAAQGDQLAQASASSPAGWQQRA
jgi:hypothetical protein